MIRKTSLSSTCSLTGWRPSLFMATLCLALCVAVASALAGLSKELSVGIIDTQTGPARSKDAYIISDMVNGLVPQFLEKSLYEQEQYAWVEHAGRLDFETASERSEALAHFREKGLNLLVVPTFRALEFESEAFGYEVLLELFDLRIWDGETVEGLSYRTRIDLGASFAVIENKISELTQRIARRIASGRTVSLLPNQTTRQSEQVLLQCIQAEDPTDRSLEAVAWRLTLELPFFLSSEALERELPYDISGLDPWLMEEHCFVSSGRYKDTPKRYRGYEQYDLVLHGWLSEIKGAMLLDVLVRTKKGNLQIPLFSSVLSHDELQSREGRRNIAKALIDALSAARQEGRI